MSVSFPDCFSDLLCDEDSGTILTVEESPGCSSAVDSLDRAENGTHTNTNSVITASDREESVAWMIKVHALYGFRPRTAYLSVNYMDRFLYSRPLPVTESGWPMQLLSVACLSLAAKMEEPLVPSLGDLQVEAPKYVFESMTIRRMELLVLTALDWRLRSITPFCFIGFFASKIDISGTLVGFLVSHATELILSNLREFSSPEYRPLSIAVAATLCAANTIPGLSVRNPGDAESWCRGLIKEEILRCYGVMESSAVSKPNRYSDTSSSSSLSSTDPCNKRRRLNM